ncbi:aspartyl/asparaginyl beta-hydroxylase isoform X2 [Cimex lectularius]|uniref:Aspartyl/asparaginy/proline hydroxylase domain-containing protein n=1 Tax=Cimex lectularius TaxID=79782 RepID=A0A8I6S4U9_CIMLE|nr:aspartyl/asparaginyl beta-hydroxylase isoform X2 [Cimex lectularius]
MSGDAQPRKRRDKRRKKGHLDQRRTEEYAEEREIIRKLSCAEEPDEEEIFAKYTHPTDEIVHVHKDDGVGGNVFTKLIFFLLLAGIGVVVGLTLIEYRGTTDEEAGLVKDTQWVATVQEWVSMVPFYGETEQESHASDEHEELDEHDQDDHDHNEHDQDNHDHNEHDLDDHGHDDHDQDEGEKSSWFSLDFSSFGWENKETESSDVDETPSSWFSWDFNLLGSSEKEEGVEKQASGEDDNELEEQVSEELEEEEEEDNLSHDQEVEEEEEEEEDGENDDQDEEEEYDKDDDQIVSQEEDEQEGLENFSENQEEEEEEEEEQDLPLEEEENVSQEYEKELSQEEDNEEEEEVEQSEEQETSRTFLAKSLNKMEDNQDVSEEELFPEAIEALRREASELLEQQAKSDKEEVENDDEEDENREDEETEGKEGHLTTEMPQMVASPPSPPVEEPPPYSPPVETPATAFSEPSYFAESLTPEPKLHPEEEEEYEEEGEEEEEEEMSEDEAPINPDVYEKIIAKYGQPSPESSDVEQSDDGDGQEYSDGGDAESVGEEESGNEVEETDPEDEEDEKPTTLKTSGKVEEESEGEYEEESDDEVVQTPAPKLQPTRGGGPRATEEEVYVNSDITNEEDWNVRQELDMADEEFNLEHLDKAFAIYESVLRTRPNSPRALHGKAQILDKQAEMKRSNAILQEAIQTYLMVVNQPKVPPTLLKLAALRCINRIRFRGQYMQSIPLHKTLISTFKNEPDYRNDMGITYLMVNRLQEAGDVFKSVLAIWPKDAMARSHYGLVLKLQGKMKESIPHLKEGLLADIPATRDARLYFHLGDALARTGQSSEAMEVYSRGVEKGMFRSKYQRSLYNIDNLTARPWWTHEQTTYQNFFKKLESNWKIILNEGLAALKSRGAFKNEAENLKDAGDWKQFELFARGVKYKENCLKTPKTCSIIEEFEPARSCKRGQSKFSVMEAGTHVWAHCGPTNCRLRAHLGLIVPKNTFIRVADEIKSWEEGKVFIFDDSFEHEVWHNGTSHRLVLIVDVWHPELTRQQRLTLSPI